MDNKSYYISLVRGLTGYYVKVLATDIEVVRKYAVKYYGELWCSVYTEEELVDFMKKYYNITKVVVINADAPVILNDNPNYA